MTVAGIEGGLFERDREKEVFMQSLALVVGAQRGSHGARE